MPNETPSEVWKYPIREIGKAFEVEMPTGAKLLTMRFQRNRAIRFQEDKFYFWALVFPPSPKVKRRFICTGTGHPIDPNLVPKLNYVGTDITEDGAFVWHLFEIVE
jgi:hypothetical protein